MDRLTTEIQARVAQDEIPKGLGALTLSLLDGEMCDWQRFKYRKAELHLIDTHSRWAAAYYQQQRQKGSGHHTAVRALAYKWQRVSAIIKPPNRTECPHHRLLESAWPPSRPTQEAVV